MTHRHTWIPDIHGTTKILRRMASITEIRVLMTTMARTTANRTLVPVVLMDTQFVRSLNMPRHQHDHNLSRTEPDYHTNKHQCYHMIAPGTYKLSNSIHSITGQSCRKIWAPKNQTSFRGYAVVLQSSDSQRIRFHPCIGLPRFPKGDTIANCSDT